MLDSRIRHKVPFHSDESRQSLRTHSGGGSDTAGAEEAEAHAEFMRSQDGDFTPWFTPHAQRVRTPRSHHKRLTCAKGMAVG